MYFFFNDTATTEIYTLSLHDALPICQAGVGVRPHEPEQQPDENHGDRLDDRAVREHDGHQEAEHHEREVIGRIELLGEDRKSTRLNSSHANISYAVFCLKKKRR